VIGSVLFAIGCFTPALVVLFGLAGLSAWMGGWLDYFVLYPGLALFLVLTAYAIYRMRRAAKEAQEVSGSEPRTSQAR